MTQTNTPTGQNVGTATGYLTLDASKFEKSLRGALDDLRDFENTAQGVNLGSNLVSDIEDITRASSKLSSAASDIKSLGEAADSSVSDFSRLSQEQRDLNRNLESVSDETDAIVETLRKLSESADRVTSSLDAMNEELGDTEEESQKATEGLEKSSSKLGGIASGIGAGLAAMGAGAVAIGGAAIKSASEVNEASRILSSSLSLTGEELERYNRITEEVYKNNFGDSLKDISETLALIRQQIGDMSDEELQQTVQAAYMLRDVYSIDIAEGIRGVNAMVKQFGISAIEAYNLMAQGAEKGLNQNQDLADQIAEYATYYGNLGFTAEEAMNKIASGVENGVYQIDKINMAVQEFSYRAIDGSDSTRGAFEALGYDADALAQIFAKGGEESAQAFNEVLKKVASIEDEVAQDAIGVALFGTAWEDSGARAVLALADTDAAIDNTRDKLGELEETAYGGLEAETQSLQRTLTLMLVPLGEALIPLGSQLISMVAPLVEQVLPPLVELIKPLAALVSRLVQSLMPILVELLNAIMPLITSLVKDLLFPLLSIIESLTPLISLVLDILDPILGLVIELVSSIGDILAVLSPLILVLTNLLTQVLTPLIPVIEYLVQGIGTDLTKAFNLVVGLISEVVVPIFSGLVSFLQGDFTGGIQGVCEGITGLFSNAFEFIDGIIGTKIASWYNQISQAAFDFGKMMADTFNASEVELNELHSKYSGTYREMLNLYAEYYKQGMEAQTALAMAYQQTFTSAEAQYTFRERFAESLTQGSLSEQAGTSGLSTEELLSILENSRGDTYNFYSPEPIDEYTAAQEMKEAKKDIVEGF